MQLFKHLALSDLFEADYIFLSLKFKIQTNDFLNYNSLNCYICLLNLSDPEVYEQALNQCKNVQACAAILMGKGAKVNLADQQGMQPLHYAMQFPSESINPLYTA